MSNKPVKGLKVGNYRITPLGLGVLGALALVLIAAILIAVLHPFGGGSDVTVANVIPDAPVTQDGGDIEGTDATPEPVVTPEPTPTP